MLSIAHFDSEKQHYNTFIFGDHGISDENFFTNQQVTTFTCQEMQKLLANLLKKCVTFKKNCVKSNLR